MDFIINGTVKKHYRVCYVPDFHPQDELGPSICMAFGAPLRYDAENKHWYILKPVWHEHLTTMK